MDLTESRLILLPVPASLVPRPSSSRLCRRCGWCRRRGTGRRSPCGGTCWCRASAMRGTQRWIGWFYGLKLGLIFQPLCVTPLTSDKRVMQLVLYTEAFCITTKEEKNGRVTLFKARSCVAGADITRGKKVHIEAYRILMALITMYLDFTSDLPVPLSLTFCVGGLNATIGQSLSPTSFRVK